MTRADFPEPARTVDERGPHRLVRPYVLTQGRTRAAGVTLAIEAPIQAALTVAELASHATPEARRIVELCQDVISIAELSARLALPIGVVRVLVGDLQAAGAVVVGAPAPATAASDVALLERLLDGIRAL
jgi:hypothetical protein